MLSLPADWTNNVCQRVSGFFKTTNCGYFKGKRNTVTLRIHGLPATPRMGIIIRPQHPRAVLFCVRRPEVHVRQKQDVGASRARWCSCLTEALLIGKQKRFYVCCLSAKPINRQTIGQTKRAASAREPNRPLPRLVRGSI